MKKLFGFLLWVVLGAAHAAGFYELDYDWNKPGKQVATATVGATIRRLAPLFVVDSTGYYEGFVGYHTKLGSVSITSYAGLEGLKGVSPRARGLVVASTSLGPLSVVTVNEFGGVAGNFHKERLWVDVGRYGIGLVRHSSAGFGPRVDYRLGSEAAVYLQYLRKGGTSRLTLAVSGQF